MSFRENNYKQLSITDCFSGLTFREQNALENHGQGFFTDELFSYIDEKRFSVLYSSSVSFERKKCAGCPYQVNVIRRTLNASSK